MNDNDTQQIHDAIQAYDDHSELVRLGDIEWECGNKAFARQMYLDAMGCLDDAYAGLGVVMEHD